MTDEQLAKLQAQSREAHKNDVAHSFLYQLEKIVKKRVPYKKHDDNFTESEEWKQKQAAIKAIADKINKTK